MYKRDDNHNVRVTTMIMVKFNYKSVERSNCLRRQYRFVVIVDTAIEILADHDTNISYLVDNDTRGAYLSSQMLCF